MEHLNGRQLRSKVQPKIHNPFHSPLRCECSISAYSQHDQLLWEGTVEGQLTSLTSNLSKSKTQGENANFLGRPALAFKTTAKRESAGFFYGSIHVVEARGSKTLRVLLLGAPGSELLLLRARRQS